MSTNESRIESFIYDNVIVKKFMIATMIWGIVGMLVGVLIAIQLYIPEFYQSMGINLEYLTFGRLRPLHTNAVIFAFVGNAIFMGVYYSLPRLSKAPMWSSLLSNVHFWGWQLIIVLAAITLPMGFTTGKEYAELEWPIDIMIALVWVAFGINMIMTLVKRREKHMYVAIWFYLGSWVTVTLLHVVNSLELPVALMKSYPVFAGVQDALVQWWYGHNAVAFFLTTPFLGLMYYFLPKAANRPVYSYKLSIIHFWSLIFLYIWAGPHHLLFTSLPGWAQSLGTVFSLMLIAPSWGGMLNGLLTLRGAFDKVRQEPILKFMVVAITAYGMATFEGPMLSVKAVNALSHYTDWTIAHVHIGALGWNGFLTFGIIYWLVPKMWNTEIFSKKMANAHFWIGTIGILLYAIPMYWAGVVQGLMWQQFDASGSLLYTNFLETVTEIIPMYIVRSVGGTLYLLGALLMGYNLIRTVKQGSFLKTETGRGIALKDQEHAEEEQNGKVKWWERSKWIEGKPIPFLIASTIVVAVGGIIEVIPMYMIESNVPTITAVKPYTPLELEGRDIYVKEGCYTCHSQMIRPFRFETARYGEYSKSGEFVYDRPFQWGSKRLGPDLHRVGGKYNNAWHYKHMMRPTDMSPGSLMPLYPHMAENEVDTTLTVDKIKLMRAMGVPYESNYENYVMRDYDKQAFEIVNDLKESAGIEVGANKEIVALIAYLQRLGTDIKGSAASTADQIK
ncbi:MAG: cytochrome-c oxidase, cbb3-type subunit I [Chlorobiota bacterium]